MTRSEEELSVGATEGPEISEEEHEVTLHAEEPVVEKRAVPKERVRLDKDTVEEEHQVSETVSKEQIEVDGAEERRVAIARAGAGARRPLPSPPT